MTTERRQIWQFEPSVGEEEKAELMACIDSGWITEAKRTREFEAQFAAYVGAKHAAAVTSGTTALSVALLAAGIGHGDEVIVPDLTMIATANAVRLTGAIPVLADLETQTYGLSPQAVEAAITPRTKAVMPVHFNGRSADIDGIRKVTEPRGILIVEDAAQALGSRAHGRHVGTSSPLGCFSLSTPKIITTGQGGMIVTDDQELHDRIVKLKDHGRLDRADDYHPEVGYNFKFTDLQAAIGLAQMKKLDGRVAHKKAMYRRYQEQLRSVEQIEHLATDLDETCPWFIDILVPDARALAAYMREQGVQLRPYYVPLHRQPAYEQTGSFAVADDASQHGVFLPSSSFLTDDDIDYICEHIRAFFAQ